MEPLESTLNDFLNQIELILKLSDTKYVKYSVAFGNYFRKVNIKKGPSLWIRSDQEEVVFYKLHQDLPLFLNHQDTLKELADGLSK